MPLNGTVEMMISGSYLSPCGLCPRDDPSLGTACSSEPVEVIVDLRAFIDQAVSPDMPANEPCGKTSIISTICTTADGCDIRFSYGSCRGYMSHAKLPVMISTFIITFLPFTVCIIQIQQQRKEYNKTKL